MTRPLRALAALALLSVPGLADSPPLTPDWKFDVLTLKKGPIHKGLLLDDGPDRVRFQIVGRVPGRPTVKFTVVFGRDEVARLDKLPDADRAVLRARLEEIDPESEARRLDKLDLRRVDWQGKAGAGLRYDSDYFSLLSDAPEEVVRRAAYRLENVYAAYARFLPPRFPGGSPTVIHVHQSFAAYQKAIPGGETLRNPAFYD